MFYAIQDGDVYILRFKYDPQLISLVKNVPGRLYVPQGKYWTIPDSHLGFLMNEIKGTPYERQTTACNNLINLYKDLRLLQSHEYLTY